MQIQITQVGHAHYIKVTNYNIHRLLYAAFGGA